MTIPKMFDPESFAVLTLIQFRARLRYDEEGLIRFLKQNQLLPQIATCPRCETWMRLGDRKLVFYFSKICSLKTQLTN